LNIRPRKLQRLLLRPWTELNSMVVFFASILPPINQKAAKEDEEDSEAAEVAIEEEEDSVVAVVISMIDVAADSVVVVAAAILKIDAADSVAAEEEEEEVVADSVEDEEEAVVVASVEDEILPLPLTTEETITMTRTKKILIFQRKRNKSTVQEPPLPNSRPCHSHFLINTKRLSRKIITHPFFPPAGPTQLTNIYS
jgi:hypothetical protein